MMALIAQVAVSVVVIIVSIVAFYYVGQWRENKKNNRPISIPPLLSIRKEGETNTWESESQLNLKQTTDSSGRQRRVSSKTTSSSLSSSPSISLQESEDADIISSSKTPECLNFSNSASHTPGLTHSGS